jgi:hypothetical protein
MPLYHSVLRLTCQPQQLKLALNHVVSIKRRPFLLLAQVRRCPAMVPDFAAHRKYMIAWVETTMMIVVYCSLDLLSKCHMEADALCFTSFLICIRCSKPDANMTCRNDRIGRQE